MPSAAERCRRVPTHSTESEIDLRLVELDSTDAAVVAGFIAICGEHKHRVAGLDHWYPLDRMDAVADRFRTADLFGVLAGDIMVAVFVLSDDPLPYYGDLGAFRGGGDHPSYLSALAVLPSHQGTGVGRYAMAQAERLVLDRGGDVIRFDAVTTNRPAVEFYRRLGYDEGGEIQVGSLTVTCFERRLVEPAAST